MSNETPRPAIEVGDWFRAHGSIHEPLYPHNCIVEVPRYLPELGPTLKFFGIPLSEIDEIRKVNGTVWRRHER
jgi:hypothetical protein